MAISRTQFYFLAGAAVLTLALYFSGSESPVKEESTAEKPSSASFDDRLTAAKSSLDAAGKSSVSVLEAQLKPDGSSDTAVLAQLGRTWDGFGNPAISAYYFEQIATRNSGEKEWLNAAYRYFDAFKMSDDSLFRAEMVQKAIDGYKKVLEINPGNLDAKTDLGVCYAEGSPQPMQGIMMLREVVQAKPDHEFAQYNLGVLSVKSGQLDKAVDRFSKVIQINPKNYEAGFLLGRCYAELGQKDKAVAALETVKSGSDNPRLVEQSDNLIHQISTNQ
jgi:tetratricopeptide (TPR) repeat protein